MEKEYYQPIIIRNSKIRNGVEKSGQSIDKLIKQAPSYPKTNGEKLKKGRY